MAICGIAIKLDPINKMRAKESVKDGISKYGLTLRIKNNIKFNILKTLTICDLKNPTIVKINNSWKFLDIGIVRA